MLVLALLVALNGATADSKPVAPSAIDEAIDRGIAFLLEQQNRNGSWGSARRTKGLNIYAPVPGAHHAFRSAVTALAIEALVEVGGDQPAVAEALDRAGDWMISNLPRLRRATPDAIYNVWGHAYSIQALLRLTRSPRTSEPKRRALRRLIEDQLELLARYEVVDGGWGYYDSEFRTQQPGGSSSSFTTATVLVAMHEADEAGVAVPEKVVRRAIASIRRQQKPDLSYLYGEYLKGRPMRGINRPGGSLGRSQACNLALSLWGDPSVTPAGMKTWLQRLVARNGWLSIGRKRPVPHEAWFQVAGYFYYYGHYYAARCIERLPADERGPLKAGVARVVLEHQDGDGSWWDFPFYDYHQPYGTAFALLTLGRCR